MIIKYLTDRSQMSTICLGGKNMARSKEFDDSVVLRKAMELFWKQGYEKTSMSELVEHMGIHRRSLYDTFGDKHSLFMKTLDVFGEYMQEELKREALRAKTPKEAIRFIFNGIIEGVWDSEQQWGCLFVNSAAELAPRDAEVKERVEKAFTQTENFIKALVIKGQMEGEINSSLDPEAMSEYLHNALLGIRVLSRNSTDKEKLYRITEFSLAILNK